MNGKILFVLLLGVSFLFFGCAQQAPQQPIAPVAPPSGEEQVMPGSDRDAHGCIGSAGYTWCEVKQKCLRTWEEPCVEGSITLDEARAIAEASACMDEGNLSGAQMYNENTRTWWFDMDIVKAGCAPACVVDEAAKSAEINWRCTGLIIPENETEEEPTGNASEEQLADLFQIETEEPLGDTGLDTGTPSSNSS